MSDDRLIVALDVPSVDDATNIITELGDSVNFYKIGYQLGYSEGGFALARELITDGKKVFLDLKLLDIDNTISHAVESIIKLGVTMLTVHAYPKTMSSAVAAASGSPLILLGVTVLTSMTDSDLTDAGYDMPAKDLVLMRAEQALNLGMGGLVASAQEASAIRTIVGDKLSIVTPGIRPLGSDIGDQRRIMTPAEAISSGASHLVVGRPIVGVSDKRGAALEYFRTNLTICDDIITHRIIIEVS